MVTMVVVKRGGFGDGDEMTSIMKRQGMNKVHEGRPMTKIIVKIEFLTISYENQNVLRKFAELTP